VTDSYFVPAKTGKAQFREKMSRFISFAIPVESHEDVKRNVTLISDEYHDARHICYAFALGQNRSDTYSTDNGEPSGTAGRPILGQIVSADLSDIVVIVVRYFGGIKLGTSGLIAAYREAARLAIEQSGTQEKIITEDISVTFPYVAMNPIMKIGKSSDVSIIRQEFDNTCRITFRVRRNMADEIKRRIGDVDGAIVTE